MKVAVTSTGADLNSQIDARFGRCQRFLIVELDDMSFEALENPNMALGGGAGIQSAQLMAEMGVKAVLTGNCGPNAYATLSAAGVEVVVGASGTVREAIELYKTGGLSAAQDANVQSKFGMGTAAPTGQTPMAGAGMGGGMGMGRGMGRGGGMGRGRGMGMGGGMGGGVVAGPSPEMTKEQEIEMMKGQARTLKQQMEQMLARIEELEKSEDG